MVSLKIGARGIVIILVVVVIAGGGIIYQFMRPSEGIDIRLMLVHGSKPQKVTIELKCAGTQTADIYKIIAFPNGINYTFAEDIVVLPGSEVRITFISIGGDVILETLSGEPAWGGGVAIMEGGADLFNQTLVDLGAIQVLGEIPVTEYGIPSILTRAGNQYTHALALQSKEYVPS